MIIAKIFAFERDNFAFGNDAKARKAIKVPSSGSLIKIFFIVCRGARGGEARSPHAEMMNILKFSSSFASTGLLSPLLGRLEAYFSR